MICLYIVGYKSCAVKSSHFLPSHFCILMLQLLFFLLIRPIFHISLILQLLSHSPFFTFSLFSSSYSFFSCYSSSHPSHSKLFRFPPPSQYPPPHSHSLSSF